MARRIPKYRLHKGSGQALVQIDGRRIYIGKYDSPESHEAYDRVIAEWLADSRRNAPQKQKSTAPGEQLTISELLLLYWRFAKTYYVHNGEPTRELESMKEALRPVRELYGHTIGCDFGPLSLKAVRQHMIERDLCRGVINNRVGRIKRFFKWAVSEELIPASVHESLKTVSGLQFEKSEARETDPVRPADEASVQKLLRYMAPPIRAMVELQRQTGMRSGEIVIMRPCDVDRSDDVWLYRPSTHKTRYRGHDKIVPLGPKAQAAISAFLDRDPQAFMFTPLEAEEWRRQQRPVHTKSRKTPIYPSELKAREKQKLARSKAKKSRLRERYDTASYRKAIQYSFKRAKRDGVHLEYWFPHQLRHLVGTKVRAEHGVEAAQVSLGHTRADVTQIYAERNLKLAIEIARKSG